MGDIPTGKASDFGRLGLVDLLVVVYCVLRVIGKTQVPCSLVLKRPASTSDLTIFYFHGGGYISSQPAHYLLFLLRLAEAILEQNVSVSIFALDYSLAPEHPFPKQLMEAAAAYNYLIYEEHISPEKIVIAGDSAGGHLALSFLVDLANKRRSSTETKGLQTPRGLVLMSPWLSLHNELPSFVMNAHKDVLSASFLRSTARHFVNDDAPMNSSYLEFLSPESEIEWSTVLPFWVWISAGADEIFIDNIKSWTKLIKSQKERVILEVGVRKVHVWQWLETVMDYDMKKKFLSRDLGDKRGFEATADVGKAIAGRVREN
ncbi:MAG: hypothetical protein Q9172_006564 [Xanthocarpia lactea]